LESLRRCCVSPLVRLSTNCEYLKASRKRIADEFRCRKVDDAVGAMPVHLVSGIWGQLAVGLFADVLNGPKGLFLGGGVYQLVVQAISAISLTLWAMSATTIIIWFVNKVVPIRLDPDDEQKGCDLTQHHWGDSYSTELQKSMSTFGKIMTITTPIAQRLAGSSSHQDSDSFGRRKPFYRNNAFEQEVRI
jgi:Ammonium Transporter Family